MDVCIYNFLRIMINPIALEQIVISTLAELSKNLMISLSVQNKIIVSKLDATQCVLWLAICVVYLRASSQRAFGKKQYKVHILLGYNKINGNRRLSNRNEHDKLLFRIIKFEFGSIRPSFGLFMYSSNLKYSGT